MDARNNLFGKSPRGGAGLPGRQGPRPGQDAGGYDSSRGSPMAPRPSSNYNSLYGGAPSADYGTPVPPPPSGGYRAPAAAASYQQQGRLIPLRIAKVEDKTLQSQFIFANLCAVSPNDFPPNRDGTDLYVRIAPKGSRDEFVVMARPVNGFPNGCISLSDPQRKWCNVGVMDELVGGLYDPFAEGGPVYLGSMDLEIGFASQNRVTDTPYDQDELADVFTRMFNGHIFAPGQRLLIDVKNVPLSILVRTVSLADLTMEKPSDAPTRRDERARGVVTGQTNIGFFKDASNPIKLKGSAKRPAANAIISPDFKFEDMGIGGLDSEFSTIFRRAFASRIFPPALIEKLGIMHVKGMLLYGPPGTGKTLIARQIGKMLNAREPKVINGPEVLNKYVGQSEENIRKMFADAEKEYKEKGDESMLHIIIFDELDAVCKQRGSGSGGGTGVGDSVVNQLLSKLDGVDQLNNILLIGMTNRKDMIDDALLRPGRLEVQIEISLPDEFGRNQILKIHTTKMVDNNIMEDDVDIAELAANTKNFSGAELNGLVKSATSFAFNRHIKVGTMAGVSDDVVNMRVNREDFMHALQEVQPAFGTNEAELEESLTYGIIHFSKYIQTIINQGLVYVENVRQNEKTKLLSVLIHGPDASGKSALAAHIAMKSDFPFVKIVTPASLVGYRDESGKKDHIHKVFTDAYKSPLSILILDNLERLIEWNPVGLRMSNTILQAMMALLQAPPPKGHRLLVLATTSQRSVMDQLDLTNIFDREISVPAVKDGAELANVLVEAGAFESTADINEAVNLVRSWTNDGSKELHVGVGIKRILSLVEDAKLSGDPVQSFAEQLAMQISRVNPRM